MPFGAEASPFILGATLRYHIDQQPEDFAETVEELRTNAYVDNLMKTGGQVEEMRKFKEETTHILEDAKFKEIGMEIGKLRNDENWDGMQWCLKS